MGGLIFYSYDHQLITYQLLLALQLVMCDRAVAFLVLDIGTHRTAEERESMMETEGGVGVSPVGSMTNP